MSKASVFILMGFLLSSNSACFDSGERARVGGKDYQKIADKAEWTWSEREASLVHCVGRLNRDFQVEIISPKGSWGDLTIRLVDEGKEVFTFKGHWGTVLARTGDTLYVANFNRGTSGCEVYSVSVKTGQEIWRTRLRGIGPTEHLEYFNHVTIDTDGQAIIVYGNESNGKYIEYLDKDSGKTIGHKLFK